jgi:hypothetical protein
MALVVCLALGLGACASDLNCEEPGLYESAVPGKRIVSPEGLDPLAEYKETKIPEVAQKSGEGQEGCVDRPPRFFSE